MKTFSNRQNAIRAARAELGADAQPGRDFKLTETAGRFGFERVTAPTEATAEPAPAVDIDDEAAVEGAVPSFLKAGQRAETSAPAEAPRPAAADAAMNDALAEIARTMLGGELADQEPAVQNALVAAFNAGAAAGKRGRAPRPHRTKAEGPSKREIAARLLQRTEGATARELMDATGWPSISVPATAKASGLTLRQEKDGRVTRYYGTPAAGAAGAAA